MTGYLLTSNLKYDVCCLLHLVYLLQIELYTSTYYFLTCNSFRALFDLYIITFD